MRYRLPLFFFAILGAFVGAFVAGSAGAQDINVAGIAITCNNCHGVGGASAGKTMPSIGGQPAEYLKTVLQQYKTGDRYSTIMGRLLKGYTDAELAALADYYSKQKWVAAGETPDPVLVQKGQQIHAGKCAGCHGPKGEMAQAMIPRLAGQWSGFIELELQTYADPKLKMPSQMMQSAVAGLSADDFRALGAFYASQK